MLRDFFYILLDSLFTDDCIIRRHAILALASAVKETEFLIIPFKGQWLLYAPPGLTLQDSTICSQSVRIVLCGSENKQRIFL